MRDMIGLRGERVQLVPLDKEWHLENYVRWFNDPEVIRYLDRVMPLTRLEEEEFFDRVSRDRDTVIWAIHDESDRHIGGTGLHAIDWRNRSATSGIVLGDTTIWGRGYATEVMRLRTQWAFEELGLHRIESECFADNAAVIRCLEKSGYKQIGTSRKRRWRAGGWHDCILWEILDEDYFGGE